MSLEAAVDDGDRVRDWQDALSRVEEDLQLAVAQADPLPWHPPSALGPIPAELVERATRLLEAQQHTIRYLEDVRRTTAKHLAAVRSTAQADANAHPVYFDLMG
ncbi:hypothetical protein ACFVWR_08070 [Leifsonia sp. NPDC058292]|uniref:hypothetical protein n=1 Tax=Leifsonia sp. NPDC058292 TaxID=3346428 RepID=UPI0036D9F993